MRRSSSSRRAIPRRDGSSRPTASATPRAPSCSPERAAWWRRCGPCRITRRRSWRRRSIGICSPAMRPSKRCARRRSRSSSTAPARAARRGPTTSATSIAGHIPPSGRRSCCSVGEVPMSGRIRFRPRFARGRMSRVALALIVLAALPAVRGAAADPLDAGAFRRAFEQAYDDHDSERIETLVRDNPTQFLPLFEGYAEIWINRKGEPGSSEERALDCARALAEAADAALEAPGLLEMMEALKSFDATKRDQLDAARKAMKRGMDAEARFDWQQALNAYVEAEAALSKLHWSAQRAVVLVLLGTCCCRLGQYQKASDCYSSALTISEGIGNQQNIAYSLQGLGDCYSSLGQFEKAIDYHSRALDIREGIGDQQGIAYSLQYLGCCYSCLGQLEKAIDYQMRGLE